MPLKKISSKSVCHSMSDLSRTASHRRTIGGRKILTLGLTKKVVLLTVPWLMTGKRELCFLGGLCLDLTGSWKKA